MPIMYRAVIFNCQKARNWREKPKACFRFRTNIAENVFCCWLDGGDVSVSVSWYDILPLKWDGNGGGGEESRMTLSAW